MLRGGRAGADGTAALIVTPPDQDRTRAHFVTTQLAKRLAARGIPTMSFDLYGCWDSLGDAREADVARWTRDIRDAAAELVRRSGATRLVGVGVRLGAPLLCAAGLDGLGLARLVLWDPVRDGAAWYAQVSAEHRVYARGLGAIRHGRPARAPAGCEELCGTTYARGTIAELARLRLAVPTGIPAQIHATTIAWHDPARIDELLPDSGISRALSDLVR